MTGDYRGEFLAARLELLRQQAEDRVRARLGRQLYGLLCPHCRAEMVADELAQMRADRPYLLRLEHELHHVEGRQ